MYLFDFFFSSRRRHTRLQGDWSSDVCSSDLFTGKVVMTKGDFVMRADQMVVHFDGTPPAPSAQRSGKTGTPASPAATDLPTFGGGRRRWRACFSASLGGGRSEEHTSELQSPCNLV